MKKAWRLLYYIMLFSPWIYIWPVANHCSLRLVILHFRLMQKILFRGFDIEMQFDHRLSVIYDAHYMFIVIVTKVGDHLVGCRKTVRNAYKALKYIATIATSLKDVD